MKMDPRKKINEERRLKRMEQIVRSKIWGEIAAKEGTKSEVKKQAEARIIELKNSYSEDKIFENEQTLSDYKIVLMRAYSEDWSKPKMEELIYFHLTNYLTEKEKFAILED